MRKMALVALSAAGIIAGCQRAPVFPEILMTYHDVEWLKANEDQIPVLVSEYDKIMNSELNQPDHPIPVAKNCGGIKSAIASIKYYLAVHTQMARARNAGEIGNESGGHRVGEYGLN